MRTRLRSTPHLYAFAPLPFLLNGFVRLMAVAGAAAVGGLFVGFVGRRIGRTVARRDMPRPPLQALRLVGALAGGWVMWLLVFAPGWDGLIGGGGSLFGGRGAGDQEAAAPAPNVRTAHQPAAAEPPQAVPAASQTVRITLLGGPRVQESRYYVVEGETQPRTLIEVKRIVKERQEKAGVRGIELLIYENSVARNHAAVRDLEQWARQNDLTVTIPPTKGDVPVA